MCGRFLVTSPVDALAGLFGFENLPNLAPRWNLAPTQQAPVVRPTETGRALHMLRWGLVPSWSKDPASGPPLINARGETVAEKPSFRQAFKAGRCLVPADGFYEWKGKGKAKQAFYVRPPGPVAFAGVAAIWRGPDGQTVESFAIVTTAATGAIAEIHHRSPVVIAANDMGDWLGDDARAAHDLIRPPPEDLFEPIEVDGRVGDVRQDDPDLIQPKPAADPAPDPDLELPGGGQMSLF